MTAPVGDRSIPYRHRCGASAGDGGGRARNSDKGVAVQINRRGCIHDDTGFSRHAGHVAGEVIAAGSRDLNTVDSSPGVFVALIGIRASTWSSVFIVGAGGPGGVRGPCAFSEKADARSRRT